MARDIERILASQRSAAAASAASPWSSGIPSTTMRASATESAPSVSFDSLRQKPPAAPRIVEDQPTRRDSLPPGMAAGVKPAQTPAPSTDPLATNAVDFKAIPTERRRLEWKPQADTAPPAAPADIALPSAATAPSKQTLPAYTEPPKPVEKKTAGIPILLLILVLLAISVLYFAVEKHLF
jgi:hypothetical protein